MVTPLSQQDKIRRGNQDSGQYFRYMAEYVGFTAEDAQAIRESALVIEKYIPDIVAKFYAQLLRYPPTRKHFLRKDGSVDQDYLQLRMRHLANFWRRTAGGVYDDDYARYVDYVGRAHTSHGADPHIYIAERYVIGQVGFMQHAISEAITKELHEVDPAWEQRANNAWTKLMMVILELLARAYGDEHEAETFGPGAEIDQNAVRDLAVEAYEFGLGLERQMEPKDVLVGPAAEIPEGERKLIDVDGLSIGVFHHKGGWYALRNSCLHRGGPVATGTLEGDVLTCPWHGYQYNVTTAALLVDASAKLATYPVELRDGQVYIRVIPTLKQAINLTIPDQPATPAPTAPAPAAQLPANAFRLNQLAPGQMGLVEVAGVPVAVYNVGGKYYATQNACTHQGGPLNEGELEGTVVTCPWHGSQFDVTDGRVVGRPAKEPVKTYQVLIEGEIGRVEPKPA